MDGATAMREIDRSVLTRALPAVTTCLEDGTNSVRLGDHWMTPIIGKGTLLLLFILPANPEFALVKTWFEVVRAWQHGAARG